MAGRLSGAIITLLLTTQSAMALPALRDVPEVRDGIVYVGIAYEISKICEELSPRYLRGAMFLRSLKTRARDMGYSEAEIDAFVDSRDEQKFLERLARDLLARMGAVEGEPETYCAVGRGQISQNTRIGWMLR